MPTLENACLALGLARAAELPTYLVIDSSVGQLFLAIQLSSLQAFQPQIDDHLPCQPTSYLCNGRLWWCPLRAVIYRCSFSIYSGHKHGAAMWSLSNLDSSSVKIRLMPLRTSS